MTPVTVLPFVTNFNTGQGYRTAIDGTVLSESPWHNRSQMDVLPTWRYMARSSGTALYPELDWEVPYYGGSSLKVSGELSPSNTTMLYLYKTDALLQGDDSFVVTWNRGGAGLPSGMEVALSTSTDPMSFTYFSVPDGPEQGWNTWEIPLSSLSGDTLSVIALRFQSTTVIDDYQIRIGRLGIIRGEQYEPAAPGGLMVEQFNQIDDNNGTIRLRWNHSPGPIYTYNVYRLNPDESRTFLWATPNNACFVPAVTRPEGEETTTILLEAVSTEFGFSPTADTQISWTTTGIESHGVHGVPAFLNDLSNPVSGVVNVGFSISAPGPVDLVVYDLAGRVVTVLHEGVASAGLHSVSWDTSDLPAGVYCQTVTAPGGSDQRKCTVLR